MSIKAFVPTGDQALVRLSDVDAPKLPPGEALVAVEAFSVNRGEILLLASGRHDAPGKDIAGRVVQAAAAASGPAVGARVVAHIDGGGWADRVAGPSAPLVTLPAH